MSITRFCTIFLTALMLILTSKTYAHPTGNMITVGENVLWSYVNPLEDTNHYACVMIWNEDTEPKVFIQSEYPASDYMLYNKQNEIYILERRHLQASQDFEIRILKTRVDSEPKIIWDWFKDDWRTGEGGFFMLSDNQIVFGRYPEIYSLKKGGTPIMYFEFDRPINRIRAVEDHQILVLGDEDCYLLQQNGTIVDQWAKLIDDSIKDAPLNRNQLFDADYANGNLLLAYWGNRSFDMVDGNGKHTTIVQQSDPLTPHWVAFFGNNKLLFSSELVFDGSMPKPNLILVNSQNDSISIWRKQ